MSILDMAVKPNPSVKGLNIKFNDNRKEALDIVLLNIDGRKIYQVELDTGNSSIDLLNLPQSIYILQVYDKHGNLQTYKLIKS
ncbi:MAG: T9SS type A sorting domain-containing protein [Bacteroidales bacterium]|nr:T9SS type A sorting domain-containing protein [Bacteroidales bacterium]